MARCRGTRLDGRPCRTPDRLVARLGGWKNPRTLDLYSQPTGTMLAEALEQRRELREVGR
jgi:hypothetical protein